MTSRVPATPPLPSPPPAIRFAPHINNGEPSPATCVQAITTESRELPVAEAEIRIRNIAERLPSNAELFKKIDSVFRGNTIAEIAAILRHARFDLAILAPAYPALDRIVSEGVLHIRDAAGDRTLPIAELLANAGCSLSALPADLSADELAATLRNCLNNPKLPILCDTANQDDLARIVSAARSLGEKDPMDRLRWPRARTGRRAFPVEAATRAAHPARPHDLLIGSPHLVTRVQVERLQIAGIAEHDLRRSHLNRSTRPCRARPNRRRGYTARGRRTRPRTDRLVSS